MIPDAPIDPRHYDQKTENPDGYRDKRGEWRPDQPISFAPLFVPPEKWVHFLAWLKDYLFSWNLFFLLITLLTWQYFQPALETCKTFQAGWIAQMFIRNMILLWIIYGGWHLYLYTYKGRGHRGKYSPRWQSKGGATFLFKDQVHDNIFWACGSGCITWTAYEVITMWMYANDRLPYIAFKTHPVWFIALFLLIPIWREFHFYWIHRLIHWKPLYDRIHYLHHYNINPGPWSGLAMHPLEHLLYFSVTLIHWVVPSHPLHFLFNSQHTALTPAAGHTGFEGALTDQVSFGSYFHYLHHRHFDCNYGEATIPLDQWFGSFEDGSRTDSEKSEARRTYRSYVVDRIVDESPEVKSFYLKRADGEALESYAPGQHLMFKVAASGTGNHALRFYTLSDGDEVNGYRISVKREAAPADQPETPPGLVSNYLHDQITVGDTIEARGPLGDFSPEQNSRRTLALISGGVGITPILAMAKACLRKHPRRKVNLYLAFRDVAHELFREEIDALVQQYPRVCCHRFFDRLEADEQEGRENLHGQRMDIGMIRNSLPNLNVEYYICGPEQMMNAILSGLKEAGVPAARLHSESFTQNQPSDSPGCQEQHEITFARSGKTLRWDSEFKNLLEFAESHGIAMEAGCMFGECGACATRVEQGDVEYNYSTATQPQQGQCLPCSCRPKSPLTLDA